MEYSDMDSYLCFPPSPQSLGSPEGQVSTPPNSPRTNYPTQSASTTAHGSKTNATLTLSPVFFPGAKLSKHIQDISLVSIDQVAFCVSSVVMLQASNNRFALLLPSVLDKNAIICVPEPSELLTIMLHALYHLSLVSCRSPLQQLAATLAKFPVYGINPLEFVKPSMPLHTVFLSYAPLYPMEVYIIAATHDLYDLAVPTSAYLLSFPLSDLTDDLCTRLGPVYLNRLVKLHLQRIAELKELLTASPHPHPETKSCNFQDQRRLGRAWMLASAYLVCSARPDLSTDVIRNTFGSLTNELNCNDCKNVLSKLTKDIIVKWSLAKRTI